MHTGTCARPCVRVFQGTTPTLSVLWRASSLVQGAGVFGIELFHGSRHCPIRSSSLKKKVLQSSDSERTLEFIKPIFSFFSLFFLEFLEE